MRSNQQFLMRSAKWLLLLVCFACLTPGKDGRGLIAKMGTSRGDSQAKAPSPAQLAEKYGKIPLSFEANQGQTDARVKFLSRGRGYSLFLTGDEAVLALQKKVAQHPPFGAAALPDPLPSSGPKKKSDNEVERPWDRKAGPALPFPSRRLADSAESSTVLRMRLIGANASAAVTGAGELPGKSNYFLGNDPHKWRTNVPTYARVKYKDVYQGVDLVYYGSQSGRLEYDFVVAPGANPTAIALAVGAEPPRAHRDAPLQIAADGDLVIPTESGEVRFQKPLIYQESSGGRREIPGGYVLKGAREVAFKVGAYDPTRPLVIDPVLAYSTYLGGSDRDSVSSVAVDASGNAYVTGFTSSSNFPTTAGAFQTALAGGANVFVTKLNPGGSALAYSTYLGGSGYDGGTGIAVDPSGNAYVGGAGDSNDFPITPGAFQTSRAGYNPFVTKLNSTGSALVYSTYLAGASGVADIYDLTVDSSGSAYVTGDTNSSDFPTTSGVFQTQRGCSYGCTNAFVTKLNPSGSGLGYSTYLGGSSYEIGVGIAVDSSGHAYVTGLTDSNDFPTTAGAFQAFLEGVGDAFVTKLNPSGSGLVYSTYLGGSGYDVGDGVAVDASGNTYVTGFTWSSNFPTTVGAFQTLLAGTTNAYVTKLNSSGSALIYSTYLGGSGSDNGFRIAVDPSGNAYVSGSSTSKNFPTTSGAFQTTLAGSQNPFFTEMNPSGSALVYSTYIGGSGSDIGGVIAVDTLGNAYLAGQTSSSDFPTTAGAFQTTFGGGQYDAFVAKFENTPQAQVTNLQNTVKNLVSAGTLNRGLGQFLLGPLNEALAALGASPAAAARASLVPAVATADSAAVRSGRTAAAIRDLNQFIFEVRLLEILRALTKAEGQILIDAAESIITALRA